MNRHQKKQSSIILVHNHLGRNLKASHADISLTNKLKPGGEIPDVAVLDQWTITKDEYLSLAEEGIM